MKHANIPLFIPHLGCPHTCIFCNQRTISGNCGFSLEQTEQTMHRALKTLGERAGEIAFFGGSFTAIDRGLMCSLLKMAKEQKDKGRVQGIRLSTRPDCINEEILDILEEYGVTSIELGIQSTDDEVLTATGRGHDKNDSQSACALITKRARFSLVGQLMLGLPGSSPEKEEQSARDICAWGADGTRIYPTAVLAGTPLAALYQKGGYIPLSLEEGVARCASLVRIFEEHRVKILRMGLCAEEGVSRDLLAGCYHPAFGELVENRLFLEEIEKELEKIPPKKGKTYTVYVAKGALSKAIGQKGSNKQQLSKQYGCLLRFAEKEGLGGRECAIEEG